jgi:hypothetical protein
MNLPSGSSDYPLLDDKWTYVPDLDQVDFDADEWEQEEVLRRLLCFAKYTTTHRLNQVTYLVLDTVSKLKSTDLTEAKELQISVGGRTSLSHRAHACLDLIPQSLHSDKPYVRIGTHVFEGQYENLIGSEMLLSEMEGPFTPLSGVLPLTTHRPRRTNFSFPFRPDQIAFTSPIRQSRTEGTTNGAFFPIPSFSPSSRP